MKYEFNTKERKNIMKKICNKIWGIVLCGAIILMAFNISLAGAASRSYVGSYEMKGGVFCKHSFNISSKMEIDVWPDSYSAGTPGVNLYVYTAEKSLFGRWTPCDFVCSGPSTNHFTKTWKHKGEIDGLYFMNPTRNDLWSGHFNLYWD